MAGDVANPRIWELADVLTAPVGSTAPTDTSGAWDATWKYLGLLSEDGLTESRTDTVTDHYAYGGILVRTTRSKHKRTITITALEDNPVVFDLVNPGSSSQTVGSVTTRTVKVPGSNPRAFGVETVDDGVTPNIVRRRVIPRGEVVEIGEVTTSDEAMQMYALTINVYPDADGVLYYDITNDPQAIESA